MNNNLYVIDKDNCPKTDSEIIMRGLCSGCSYYKGFEMYYDQPCIKCSYYFEIGDNKNE